MGQSGVSVSGAAHSQRRQCALLKSCCENLPHFTGMAPPDIPRLFSQCSDFCGHEVNLSERDIEIQQCVPFFSGLSTSCHFSTHNCLDSQPHVRFRVALIVEVAHLGYFLGRSVVRMSAEGL